MQKSQTKIVAFPLVTKFDYAHVYHQYDLQKELMAKLRGVTEHEIEDGEEEIFVDFRNRAEGEIIMKIRNLVKRNETVRKRVKLVDKDHLNILRIFLDTVSRNEFYRKYKKTTKIL
jgi:hypothetical protein